MDWHWNTGIQWSLLFSSVKNSSLDFFDTVKKFIEKLMKQSMMTKLLMNARKSNPTIWILVRRDEEGLRQAKGGGQKKRFQYCLNPNYPHQFLYFRAIQGHSGSTINPALQDNVLLPEGFTEYIYQVGNGNELRSIVNHGLIRSQSQSRQTSCVLHCCESDG